MMTRIKKKHPYYNYNRLDSFNAVYNFLCGGRGLGKTFGAKKKAINKFLRNGEQFIYMRRYKPELQASARSFFADIQAEGLFPEWDFRVNGSIFEAAPAATRGEKKRQWTVMGYAIALSVAAGQKSVAFPLVTSVIFDEFIIEKGAIQYLPNEHIAFQEFYSTVDRWQDKTRVYFLSNAVSINNPYFLAYGILPDAEEFIQKRDGFILCHFPDSKNFAESVSKSRFGKFIQDTEYAEYAVGNKFKDNNDSLLTEKTSKFREQYILETKQGSFSVWHNMFSGEYFIQKKLPKDVPIFTLDIKRMDEGKTLMGMNDKMLQYLRANFNKGNVLFDQAPTRNIFMEIFKR